MRQPQDKVSEPLAELPNPELNPLLNPTLGRNLGRWAEVYFTSPPEKREEAVEELLRELKATPGGTEAATESVTPRVSIQTQPFEPVESPLPEPSWECPDCGHRHANLQRFCGMCGAPLLDASQANLEDHRVSKAVVEELPPRHEYIFAQGPLFGTKPPSTIPPQANSNNDSDISWLREKNLSGGDSSARRIPKLAPAALAMLAIGILIYVQSRPQTGLSRPATSTTQASVPRPQPAAEPSDGPPQAAPLTTAAQAKPVPPSPSSDTSDPSPSSQPGAPKQTQSAQSTAVPTQRASKPEPTPATEMARASSLADISANSATNGSQELALAEDYLNGKRGPRDSAEAAKFLWKAVGKENPSAILLLSDMYLVGDGVPKSCDQARLLLTAAVRKNVPQATQKLRNLLVSGCP